MTTPQRAQRLERRSAPGWRRSANKRGVPFAPPVAEEEDEEVTASAVPAATGSMISPPRWLSDGC